jgi:hypothetical protein
MEGDFLFFFPFKLKKVGRFTVTGNTSTKHITGPLPPLLFILSNTTVLLLQ